MEIGTSCDDKHKDSYSIFFFWSKVWGAAPSTWGDCARARRGGDMEAQLLGIEHGPFLSECTAAKAHCLLPSDLSLCMQTVIPFQLNKLATLTLLGFVKKNHSLHLPVYITHSV